MTKVEDLMWLYKMAVDYDLNAEKEWLKEYIEEQVKVSVAKAPLVLVMENPTETVSPLDSEKIAA